MHPNIINMLFGIFKNSIVKYYTPSE